MITARYMVSEEEQTVKPGKMKKILCIDLETIANRRLKHLLPEIKPKEFKPAPLNKNLKDPSKIEEDKRKKEEKNNEQKKSILEDFEERKLKQISEMSLNPHLNIICCAGWYDPQKDESGNILLEGETEEDEKKLLIEYWEKLHDYDHFVTFNGRQFDIPCLLFHGIPHKIKPAVAIDRGRYNKGNHTDLRVVFSEDPFAKGNFDFLLKRYVRSQKKEGINGKDVQKYWDMGFSDIISEYCEDDCYKNWLMYSALMDAGLIE